MQLTNLDVLNALQAFSVLSQKKLPIKAAWKVTTAIRSLDAFAKAADESMKELRLKYAALDEQGNPLPAKDDNGLPLENTVQIPNDKIPLLNAEMNELLSQKVEVHNVTLKLSDFPESLELEPAVLNSLMNLLIDE